MKISTLTNGRDSYYDIIKEIFPFPLSKIDFFGDDYFLVVFCRIRF